MAVRAQVVGAPDSHFAHCGEKRLGAQLPVVRLMTARTRNAALIVGRGWESQQFGQGRCPGLMHGRAHRHLDGFQIEMARLVAALEDHAQQLV